VAPEAKARDAAPEDQRLMALLVEGRTDAEIAEELGETPERVGQMLSALYVRMGARGRVDATVLALTGQL
jgi:DNA-binding NarL/FixJ family response regulator